MEKEYRQYRIFLRQNITVSKIFTSLSTLTSLRCIHMPQMSQHQQGPISPMKGTTPYKGLQTRPLRRSLLRHGTCPNMYCFQFELHTLDGVLVLRSALWKRNLIIPCLATSRKYSFWVNLCAEILHINSKQWHRWWNDKITLEMVTHTHVYIINSDKWANLCQGWSCNVVCDQ
jgi:hypothetical protein